MTHVYESARRGGDNFDGVPLLGGALFELGLPPVQVLQKKVSGSVISTSTNTGTISRESTDFIFYPVPYALACQK